MPLFSLGVLAFLLGGCAAVAVVSTAASVTTTAVKTSAKGVGAAGRMTYRGARAVVGPGEPAAAEPAAHEASNRDKPRALDPHAR